MDVGRAVLKVDELVSLCDDLVRLEANGRGGPYAYFDDPAWKQRKADVDERIGACVRIANELDSALGERLQEAHRQGQPMAEASVAREIVGRLRTDSETDEILGPEGPKLAAADLHPWIWNQAAPLWSHGHHRSAVQTAATALFDGHLPDKLGRGQDTKGGKDVAGQAFATAEPAPNSPRLRLPGYDRATRQQDWTSAHEGAMYLGMGAAQAIRNLTSHNTEELDEQEALEMLATLSLFARMVDRAEIEKAP